MATLFYHASHEQFSPADLLTYVKLAEKAGFDGCHSSDHFYPWSEQQGQSGYAFSWLGAAMEATRFPFGIITAPGQRYHPAIVAQAIATLLQMYPDRLGVSLGSGEALNESVTGDPWPEKSVRNQRLLESAQIIRSLLSGEEVTHEGLVKVHHAKLYTRPLIAPKIFCAALSKETASWASDWAEGLLTTYQANGKLEDIIAAFRKKDSKKPVHVKFTFSFSKDKALALAEAHHQWRCNCVKTLELAELDSVADFDKAAANITPEKVASALPVTDSTDELMDIITEIEAMGVEQIVLHNVGRNQEEFIEDFGKSITER
jgi:coenzyme F420-dependent glucose-6-phosphate dehydrogenase